MKFRFFAASLMLLSSSIVNAQGIAGTWNVVSEAGTEHNCKAASSGSSQAYLWIVSTEPSGKVNISVQGETGFKKLQGVWFPDESLLVLDGQSNSAFSQSSSWFKLGLTSDNKLEGVRRYLGQSGNIWNASFPCFADFKITATKQ